MSGNGGQQEFIRRPENGRARYAWDPFHVARVFNIFNRAGEHLPRGSDGGPRAGRARRTWQPTFQAWVGKPMLRGGSHGRWFAHGHLVGPLHTSLTRRSFTDCDAIHNFSGIARSGRVKGI